MSRLTTFPPKFDPAIPSLEENPHWRFFRFTRQFLFKQQRSWDFSKQENVRRFNVALTKAIHQDADLVKTIFASFRERLQPVAKAFESFNEVETFFVNFEEYADDCLSKDFEFTKFRNYVGKLKEQINHYVKLLKSYEHFETPLTWPSPETHTELIAPIGIPDKMSYLFGIYVRSRNQPNKNVVMNAIKFFHLSNQMYEAVQSEYLKPQYKQLAKWLSESQCLKDIGREFHERQDTLYSKIKQRLEANDASIEELQYMIEKDKHVQLSDGMKDSVEDSVEAVRDATISHKEMVDIEHEYILDVVLQAYDHALDVLKPFQELTSSKYALGPEIGPTSHQERDDAKEAAEKWTAALKAEKKSLHAAKTLPYYLEDLPKLYAHIAQFSFINCGDLH